MAVLNASGRAGAAGALARQLRASGIVVTTVGNLAPAGQAAGLIVFYAPGRETQATSIAHALRSSATLEPLDPATQTAAGTQSPVVVVLH